MITQSTHRGRLLEIWALNGCGHEGTSSPMMKETTKSVFIAFLIALAIFPTISKYSPK
jgi:hypothetical protein